MATDLERIGDGKFNAAFRSALRDYYSYGFKNMADYLIGSSAENGNRADNRRVSDDWRRLTAILSGSGMKWTWSKNRKQTMFLSLDCQLQSENPFLRVYRFRAYNPAYLRDFLLFTAALSRGRIALRGGAERLGLSEERAAEIDTQMQSGSVATGCLADLVPVRGSADDPVKTPKNHLLALAEMGLVQTEKVSGSYRWRLSDLTLGQLLEQGCRTDKAFERHFRDALAFYTGHFRFGEAGMFLQDRLGSASNPFRFKHAYFMHALNDFNLLDLLSAIKEKRWCRIRYCRGYGKPKTDLLCYPLQVRTSSTTGQEHLMYYEPFRRSCSALRVEFIDSITYHSDAEVKQVLPDGGASIDGDIVNAMAAVEHCWGVSASTAAEGNAARPAAPHRVSFRIAYDKDRQAYIPLRLERERRGGSVRGPYAGSSPSEAYLDFTAQVSDPGEMRPWILSFSGRIVSCQGLDSVVPPRVGASSSWDMPDEAKKKLKGGEPAKEHDRLFSEIFSIYYHIAADVFLQICARENGFTKEELDALILDTVKEKYASRIGEKTVKQLREELWTLFSSDAFSTAGKGKRVPKGSGTFFLEQVDLRFSNFRCGPQMDLYRDIVPLSTLEKRWLLTIIRDPKMCLFLSEDERRVVESLCSNGGQTPLPVDEQFLCHYDRFHTRAEDRTRERSAMVKALEAIHENRAVYVRYRTKQQGVIEGVFDPLILEYSERNDHFQGYFWSRRYGKIMCFNLARFAHLSPIPQISRKQSPDALDAYREERSKSVRIQFADRKNVVDRLLNELSPWEKRCSYDRDTGIYSLELSYQTADREELAIRLLGYGEDIRFPDEEDPLYACVKTRLESQSAILDWLAGERAGDAPHI